MFSTWPYFDDEMIDAATRVLRSGKVNYWTGGEGQAFETEFAQFIGCQHAIAVANGTVALELALYALGIGPGDEVIVPSRTFIATASAVVARGARPVCVDVDRDSQLITAATISPHLSPQTKAVIPVHLGGWPCDVASIASLVRSRGIAIIEDCAQAHGAEYKGRRVGSLGDAAAFSFCQDKIITTGGEGGMLVTNRTDVWDRAWSYKDHGKRPEAFYAPATSSQQFRWLHDSFGSNFRMTEMQSAIGRVALRRLPDWLKTRRSHAALLTDYCSACPALRTPQPPRDINHAHYKFYSFVRPELLAPSWNRDRILAEINAAGIPCFTGSCSEIYREAAFPEDWRPATRHTIARELGETSLMFLVHPTLTDADIQRTGAAIQSTMQQATRSTRAAA
jgi:dTDP-4-amino-4,6-dideoxygalactose transaminase